MKSERREWRKHPQHGYMLRCYFEQGWCMVVTALCQNTAETEEDPKAWEAHKSRLHVNGGCGAIAAEQMQEGNINPAFVLINESDVPQHIQKDFWAAVED